MKVKIFFTIIAISTLAFSVQAQTCSEASVQDKNIKSVDLRNELGPVRDQDSVGWCYAFTAADMLTQYLRKNGQLTGDLSNRSQTVSPVGIAGWFNKTFFKNYYKNIEKMDSKQLKNFNEKMDRLAKANGDEWETVGVVPEGGIIDIGLEDTVKNGYCLESDAPSETFSIVLAKYCMEKNICATNLEDVLSHIYDRALFDKADEKAICDLYEIARIAYPNVPEKILRSVLSKTSRDKVFYDLAGVACTKKIKLPSTSKKAGFVQNLAIDENINEPTDKLIVALENALDKGSIVGISFYADVFRGENAPKTEGHASSVVGKFFDPKTCEVQYILRNSWGPSCGEYEASPKEYFDCVIKTSDKEVVVEDGVDPTFAKEHLCSTKFPPKTRNPKVSCDPNTGYVYVARSELKNYMREVSFIPN